MKDSFQKGFTLLELLVVMGIIILFSGMSFAAYGNFNEDRKLNDEAKKLVNVLNLTSKKTTAAEVNSLCPTFNGYMTRVVANSTPDRYTLNCCNDASCSGPVQLQQYNLPLNFDITLNPSANSVDIRYLVLSRGVTIPQTIIKIKNTKITKCINLTIAPSGIVTESEKYGQADGC